MGELRSIELDQLLGIFREQSLQIVDEMGHDLLALESGTADDDTMTRLRRGAHTIKGDSACVGLEGITQITHKIEDAFAAALEGQMSFDRRSVDVMLKGLGDPKYRACPLLRRMVAAGYLGRKTGRGFYRY